MSYGNIGIGEVGVEVEISVDLGVGRGFIGVVGEEVEDVVVVIVVGFDY